MIKNQAFVLCSYYLFNSIQIFCTCCSKRVLILWILALAPHCKTQKALH